MTASGRLLPDASGHYRSTFAGHNRHKPLRSASVNSNLISSQRQCTWVISASSYVAHKQGAQPIAKYIAWLAPG